MLSEQFAPIRTNGSDVFYDGDRWTGIAVLEVARLAALHKNRQEIHTSIDCIAPACAPCIAAGEATW
eukprot:8415475-Lingulodinium_polyedra.AAC.1